MPQIDWVAVIGFVTVIGFLWNLHLDMAGIHRDIGDLRECMAKVEGLLEGYMRVRRLKEGSHDE